MRKYKVHLDFFQFSCCGSIVNYQREKGVNDIFQWLRSSDKYIRSLMIEN